MGRIILDVPVPILVKDFTLSLLFYFYIGEYVEVQGFHLAWKLSMFLTWDWRNIVIGSCHSSCQATAISIWGIEFTLKPQKGVPAGWLGIHTYTHCLPASHLE